MTKINTNQSNSLGSVSDPSKTSSGSTDTSTNKNQSSQFSALEETARKLRIDEQSTKNSELGSNKKASEFSKESTDAKKSSNQAEVNSTLAINQSNQSESNANNLKNEAVNLKATARGKSPQVARMLKSQAEEKELEALIEEYNVQKAKNDAEEQKRMAESKKSEANDKTGSKNSSTSNANNFQKENKDVNVNLSNTQLKMNQDKSQSLAVNNTATGIPPRAVNASPLTASTSAQGVGNAVSFGVLGPYITAAEALLRAVSVNTNAPGRRTTPTELLSMHNTNKTLLDLAISTLDAAQTVSTLYGSPISQKIIFLKTQASGQKGETENNIQYYTQQQKLTEQAEKDTHEHFKRA